MVASSPPLDVGKTPARFDQAVHEIGGGRLGLPAGVDEADQI